MRPHVIFRTIDALRAKRLQQTRKHDKRGIEAGQKHGCLREFGKVVLELVRSAFGHETSGTAARTVSQPSTMKFRKPLRTFVGSTFMVCCYDFDSGTWQRAKFTCVNSAVPCGRKPRKRCRHACAQAGAERVWSAFGTVSDPGLLRTFTLFATSVCVAGAELSQSQVQIS